MWDSVIRFFYFYFHAIRLSARFLLCTAFFFLFVLFYAVRFSFWFLLLTVFFVCFVWFCFSFFLVWSTYWLLVSVSPGIFAKPTWQITPWPTNLVACLSKGRSTAIARAVKTIVFRAVSPTYEVRSLPGFLSPLMCTADPAWFAFALLTCTYHRILANEWLSC